MLMIKVLLLRVPIGQGLGGNTELHCSLPMESESVTLPAYQRVHQPANSTELWCPEILLEFHHGGMIHEISGHVLELSFQLPPVPEVGLVHVSAL